MSENKPKIDKIKRLSQEVKIIIKNFPKVAGAAAVNFSKDNFRRQGFSGEPRWKSTLDGKKDGVLIKTGTMRRQIKIISVEVSASESSVVFGVEDKKVRVSGSEYNVSDYANIHNEGGLIRVTDKSRRYFWAKYYEAKNRKNMTKALFWKKLALTKKTHFAMPKRKFIGISDRMSAHVLYVLMKELNK